MSDDVLVFAPRPQRVAFLIDGARVETALYNFLDLPCKDALEVYRLEDEMRSQTGGWPDHIETLRRIMRLLAPDLPQPQLEALTPHQLQDGVAASHGVTVPPQGAEATTATDSRSASAGSTTPSP